MIHFPTSVLIVEPSELDSMLSFNTWIIVP